MAEESSDSFPPGVECAACPSPEEKETAERPQRGFVWSKQSEGTTPGTPIGFPQQLGWEPWDAEKCCTGYGKATGMVTNMGKHFSLTQPRLELQLETTLEASLHNNNKSFSSLKIITKIKNQKTKQKPCFIQVGFSSCSVSVWIVSMWSVKVPFMAPAGFW